MYVACCMLHTFCFGSHCIMVFFSVIQICFSLSVLLYSMYVACCMLFWITLYNGFLMLYRLASLFLFYCTLCMLHVACCFGSHYKMGFCNTHTHTHTHTCVCGSILDWITLFKSFVKEMLVLFSFCFIVR